MSEFRRWAFWRRVEYGTYFFLLWAGFFTLMYFLYFFTPNSCFDKQMNGDERAVDCGGSCVRICPFEVRPPEVVWAESFMVYPDQYNALAYVENKNQVAATPELSYTFRMYDESGSLVTERSGSTVLPPNSVYPIFEGRIKTDGREVVRTEIELSNAELWLPATIGRDQFLTRDLELIGADLLPRLNVTLENTELVEAKNVEVVATIFDAAGTPLTGSQTFVDIFDPRSKEDIVFTWPVPIAKTVRSCEVPTDVVVAIDLSGSMNDDGDTPPEPITSVLMSAGNFVENLRDRDLVSIATFATEANISLPLTTNIPLAKRTVETLVIPPAEESGFTNTGAALRAARAELGSERHNTDARKVLVLLTDGLATAPEPDPEAFALEEAQALRAEDIEMYTIGLGDAVNMEFLKAISEEEDNAFFAPTTDDLTSIYNTITSDICEDGAARIDIIPKTDANFAPLR